MDKPIGIHQLTTGKVHTQVEAKCKQIAREMERKAVENAQQEKKPKDGES